MDDLENYLTSLKEDNHIELKTGERKVPSSFYETYSAFANTDGGTIYLGIKEGNPNTIIGVENPQEQIKAILSTLENRQKVSTNVISGNDYKIITVGGKKVIEIKVREATRQEKPVYLNSSYSFSYKRVGEVDKFLSEAEVQSKLIDRDPISRDLVVNPLNLSIEDLDSNSLSKYRERLLFYRPEDELKNLSDDELLTRIGAYRKKENGEKGLSNAAILFFGKWQDIIGIFPYYFLDYQYVDGSKFERWKKRFSSDELSWPGNIYSFYLKIEETIAQYLPNPFKREEDNNYDGKDILEACLEVVINALSNASYTLPGGVKIKQGPNYFQVDNPGDIIVGEEQAKAGGLSMPRNPAILNFFRLLGVAEKSGLGVPKVFSVASRYDFPKPNQYVNKEFDMTRMHVSFLSLPLDTPSRELKLKIISYLSNKKEGSEATSIAKSLGCSVSQTALACRELIASGIIVTNLKKKKGRKLFLNQDY